MDIIVYLLPFFIAFILLIFFKRYIVWWEYICLILGSLLFSYLIEQTMIYSRECDTEYWGGYITKITHYDEWDEWIHRTCTRQVPDGVDKDGNTKYREEEYDCSYREYHPERWMYTDDMGRENYFYNKEEFNRAMVELGHPKMVFRDMHRNYYRIDGDAQDYFYDGTVQHIRALTWKHQYRNKIIASNSIFKFEDVDDEEARKLGLFNYPNLYEQDQNVILGLNLGNKTHKEFKYINAIYGKKKQFRTYILIFTDKPYSISEKQKSYWQGGNKNEFIVCLGYNSKSGKVDWCNAFSWCDKPELEVATKRYFREHPYIAYLDGYAKWLKDNLNKWHRKEFKDFDYIENTLTKGQEIGLFIIILIADIIASIFLIGNEFRNEDLYDAPLLYDFKVAQRSLFHNIAMWISDLFAVLIEKIEDVRYILNNIRIWK